MKAQIKEAVEYMVSTYDSLQTAARGFVNLNYDEVKSELDKAEPDTAEAVALAALIQVLVKPSAAVKDEAE